MPSSKPPVGQAEAAAKSVVAPGQAAPKTDEKAGKPAGEKPGLASAAPVDSSELVLGSASDKTPGGYRLEVQLEQKGAGVESVLSSRYDAEFEGRINPHLPLQLIRRDPVWRGHRFRLTMSVDPVASADAGPRAGNPEQDPGGDQPNLIPPPKTCLTRCSGRSCAMTTGRIVQPLTGEDPSSGKAIQGQQVSFRTTASNGVVVTKTFRLWQTMDGLELELEFESPDRGSDLLVQPARPARHPDRRRMVHRDFPRGLLRNLRIRARSRSTHIPPMTSPRHVTSRSRARPCRCGSRGSRTSISRR